MTALRVVFEWHSLQTHTPPAEIQTIATSNPYPDLRLTDPSPSYAGEESSLLGRLYISARRCSTKAEVPLECFHIDDCGSIPTIMKTGSGCEGILRHPPKPNKPRSFGRAQAPLKFSTFSRLGKPQPQVPQITNAIISQLVATSSVNISLVTYQFATLITLRSFLHQILTDES